MKFYIKIFLCHNTLPNFQKTSFTLPMRIPITVSHIPLLVKTQHSEATFTLGKNVLGFSSVRKQLIDKY